MIIKHIIKHSFMSNSAFRAEFFPLASGGEDDRQWTSPRARLHMPDASVRTRQRLFGVVFPGLFQNTYQIILKDSAEFVMKLGMEKEQKIESFRGRRAHGKRGRTAVRRVAKDLVNCSS
jgi:hypothetical protein